MPFWSISATKWRSLGEAEWPNNKKNANSLEKIKKKVERARIFSCSVPRRNANARRTHLLFLSSSSFYYFFFFSPRPFRWSLRRWRNRVSQRYTHWFPTGAQSLFRLCYETKDGPEEDPGLKMVKNPWTRVQHSSQFNTSHDFYISSNIFFRTTLNVIKKNKYIKEEKRNKAARAGHTLRNELTLSSSSRALLALCWSVALFNTDTGARKKRRRSMQAISATIHAALPTTLSHVTWEWNQRPYLWTAVRPFHPKWIPDHLKIVHYFTPFANAR